MNILESYDFVMCSVCCTTSSNCFLNIFENFIRYQMKYFSLADIINESLCLEMTNHEGCPKQICTSCKDKIVDFFIFKKRNEEARKIYRDSQYKALILEVTEEGAVVQDKFLDIPSNDNDSNLPELTPNSQIYLNFSSSTFSTYEETQDVFNEESDELQLLFVKPPMESPENIDPPKKKLHPENWERTRRKIARNMGMSYVATSGKEVEAKRMKADCGQKCRMQCNSRIKEETRLKNFNEFYTLADLELQRKFILDHIQIFEPKHVKIPDSGKSRSIQRIFFLSGEKEEMVQVCKLMFLNTLVISSQTLDTIQFKASNFGSMIDLRGKYPRKKG